MLGIGEKHAAPTILIVDDDLVSREVMATVLTMSGYMVHTAASGTESLALLDTRACVPELILMDTQMPGLSGILLVEQLRARSKAGLYAISGSNAPDDVMAAVDGFLMKPFRSEAVDKLLEQHAPATLPELKSDGPVINTRILAQLRDLMPEAAVRQIYSAIVADLDKRTASLRMALANGDADEIRRIGHSIKGGCGLAGAVEAARLGALLEEQGDHLDYVAAILAELQTATRNLERMLEDDFPA
jgi:CheY-like chemotaxis protein